MLKREEAIEALKEVIKELEEYHPITSKKVKEVIDFLEG